MRRFEVSELGHAPLPAIDLADAVVIIGSGPAARVRLPAPAARDAHLRIEDDRWQASAEITVDGTRHGAGASGPLGESTTFDLGGYRVRVSSSPASAEPAHVRRTESLARELVRSLLGDGAVPTFEIAHGPHRGSRRELAPPPSTLVIGRGDEADWVILDQDLSRSHAKVTRTWDGIALCDLGSKNGTLVDGVRIHEAVTLRDGARITLGQVVLSFADPAERHLRGESVASDQETGDGPAAMAPGASGPAEGSTSATGDAASGPAFWIAAALACLAAGGLVWILAGS